MGITEVLSTLSYELPAELLKAYNRLLDKKFSSGLTSDEEAELVRIDQQIDEAELETPLVQFTLTKAAQQHKQWMRTLNEVITKLRELREST
jgi:phage shock protein A